MPLTWKKAVWPFTLLSVLVTLPHLIAKSEQYSKADRDLARQMLHNVAADVPKYYYDSKLHGVDWVSKTRETQNNIDSADSLDSAVSEIAALLDSLNDSHTFFFPPPRSSSHDYGFTMEMVGERCFVTHVKPDSDAAKKGLAPGDEVLAINEHPISRKDFWRIQYIYNVLRPQRGLLLNVTDVAGQQRSIEIAAKFRTSTVKYFLHQGINQYVRDLESGHQQLRARYFEKGQALLVIKIPQFTLSPSEVDDIIGNMRKHKSVVLDLRGNPGGFTVTLDRLLGGIFQYDEKIFDRVQRNSTKSVVATGRRNDAYTGKFAVLIDSESASASELFARVVQLERRGLVFGDRSAGMVMEAKRYTHEVTMDSGVYYGSSITDADLLMADGKSLEHVGVEPDILILPSALDLTKARDPVLAKAAGLSGVPLTAEEAGAAFPYEEVSDQ